MEFIAKIGDTLLFDEGENCQVLDRCEYNGKNYLFCMTVPIEIEAIFDAKKRKTFFAQEVVDENNNYGLGIVEDKTIIKAIKEILRNSETSKSYLKK